MIVSAGQGQGKLRYGRTFFVAPLKETLDRADRLASEFGVSLSAAAAELRARADALSEG